MRPAFLERLLRQEVFSDSVAQIIAELRRSYESYSDQEFRRVWCYTIYHRLRYHIGSHVFPDSFEAWPLVPVVDMKVLEVVAGLPESSLKARRLQKELVCRRFPKLAALPLDHNTYSMDPLRPGFGWRLRRYVEGRVIRKLVPGGPPREERRRYYRLYDINGPGWRSVREAVEPYRRLADEYFHPAVLDELVPPPQAELVFKDSISGSAGMKTVLGFLWWLGRRREGRAEA